MDLRKLNQENRSHNRNESMQSNDSKNVTRKRQSDSRSKVENDTRSKAKRKTNMKAQQSIDQNELLAKESSAHKVKKGGKAAMPPIEQMNFYDVDGLPDQITDEYQQEPYQQISKVKYINMIICHAISTNDELKFMKLMHKLQLIKEMSEEDETIK